jgi:hypothetical protein
VFIDHNARPEDFPEPAAPNQVARDFPVPLLTLAAHPSIEESWIGLMSQTGMHAATISYTYWRNRLDRDDPANLADLPADVASQLDAEPVWPLPDWMVRIRERMRYPMLWEAVRTTHISDNSAVVWQTPEYTLVEHANYILMNTFREERMRGAFPGKLDGRITEAAIERDIPVSVDGVDVPGMRIDTDPHVVALGADLGDRILTAVLPRDYLELVGFTFRTRP